MLKNVERFYEMWVLHSSDIIKFRIVSINFIEKVCQSYWVITFLLATRSWTDLVVVVPVWEVYTVSVNSLVQKWKAKETGKLLPEIEPNYKHDPLSHYRDGSRTLYTELGGDLQTSSHAPNTQRDTVQILECVSFFTHL